MGQNDVVLQWSRQRRYSAAIYKGEEGLSDMDDGVRFRVVVSAFTSMVKGGLSGRWA